jgi:ribosome-associated protein
MSNEFISKEIDKIMSDKKYDFPLNLAMSAAWILGNFKGINLKIHDVRGVSSLGDYYVIASVTNPTQAQSMAGTIQQQLERFDAPCKSLEGSKSSEWLLLDHGDILIHIFLDTAREVFDLDSLLKDSPIIEIPNEYYHSHFDDDTQNEDKNYF